MKRYLLSALGALVLLTACNSKPEVKKDDKAAAQVKSAATIVDPVTKKMDELKKMSPLGLDELSAWLPEKLNGIKRTNLSVSNNLGYAVAHADYEKNSKTDIRVTIYDCAGTEGADWYNRTYFSKLGTQQEDSTGYVKSVDVMGNKAIEKMDKSNMVTTITYVTNNRILIVISGRNIGADDLKQSAQQLNVKQS